jgi:type II restriction/modification system DNA methylase subunit YeeA
LQDYLKQIPKPTFVPNEDNITLIQEDEYFSDDIVEQFKKILRVTFGSAKYEENIAFIEEAIGKEIRKYFMNDFYKDHFKRYKKRPIYWMFSSPKRSFNVLIYMHRYRPDTISTILNDYLRVFISKLESKKTTLNSVAISESASAREKTRATKDIDSIESKLKELKTYEQTLHDFAARKIELDLDDGVKVNYLKFKEILAPIPGLDRDEE